MKENPNYYAVIPARVLFDKNICAEAKILYGQIASLCNKEGFCWAGNAYFADLHAVSDRTVQRWLMSLKDSGYVSVEFTLVDGTREIQTRKIRIADAAPRKNTPDPPSPESPPPDPPPCPHPDGDAEVVTILSPPGDISVGGVVTNLSRGGDKIVGDNIININKTTTTAAPTLVPEKPPDPAPVAAVAALSTTAGKIKTECLRIDSRLVFDRAFYPRAAAFLAQNSLDLRYLAWLHSYCESKNPRTLTGMFFKIFFADNVAALYRAEREPEPNADATPEPPLCPVCGHRFAPGEDSCPACRLSAHDARFGDDDRLARARAFFALPPNQKAAYDRDIDALVNGDGNTLAKIKRSAEINARYGLPP